MTVAERLKEERERLGLSQPRWGELAKVVKQTVIQWEKGASAPDAVQLSALAAAGADVLYILTGAYSGGVPVLNGKPLTREEACFLDNYRHCPPEGQAAIEATVAAFAQPKCGKKAG